MVELVWRWPPSDPAERVFILWCSYCGAGTALDPDRMMSWAEIREDQEPLGWKCLEEPCNAHSLDACPSCVQMLDQGIALDPKPNRLYDFEGE